MVIYIKDTSLKKKVSLKGKIVSVSEAGVVDEENLPIDFSITKAVVGMLSAAIIGLLLFLLLARSYRKTGISHPKGIQSFLEPVILFVRDDIAIPNIGVHKYEEIYALSLICFLFYSYKQPYGAYPVPSAFWSKCYG